MKIYFSLLQRVSKLEVFVLFSILSLVFFPFLYKNNVLAEGSTDTYVYDSINVDITQNEDSTMLVTEELVYRFNGLFHALTREISLDDQNKVDKCKGNPYLQCGGYEFLEILEVKDNYGNILVPAKENEIKRDSLGRAITSDDKYVVQSIEKNGDKRIFIQWLFSEKGKKFDNETMKFTISYLVYGAPGYFDDYDLLYWNAIFGDRTVPVENIKISINYPGVVDTSPSSLNIPGQRENFVISTTNSGKTVNIIKQNLSSGDNFTVMQKLPKGMIQKYATIHLELDPKNQEVLYNGKIPFSSVSKIAGIPPGKVNLKFSAPKRETQTEEFELASGEEKSLIIHLQLTRAELIKYKIFLLINVASMAFLPLGLLLVYRLWKKRGKDNLTNKVVVPEYTPPSDIRPYLLGSLKDEQVDMVDITATIIDLAYRGYIKIIEHSGQKILGINIKKSDFELKKLKDYAELSSSEKELMDALFTGRDRVTTKDLQNQFYTKLPTIKTKVYEEMVDKNYFKESPARVRSRYLTYGFLVLVFTILLIFANAQVPIFIGATISFGILGIVILLISKHMPSKTELGSEIFNKVLGFKMYMETAEKYRVQNLTPETFEKFLSYAVVFGVEKQWAEKFKDIYKGKPDWYEGNTNTFSTIYLANALSNFSTSTATVMTSSPSSSGTGSTGWSGGSGWSGGGGFSGGFSGGGGGGGGGGAW